MGGSSSRRTGSETTTGPQTQTFNLSPEQRQLFGQEVQLRQSFLDRFQEPTFGLIGQAIGGIPQGGFAVPQGLPTGQVAQQAVAGQFAPTQFTTAQRQATIGAAQAASQPAIEAITRTVRETQAGRGLLDSSQTGIELGRALAPQSAQLAAIGGQAGAREFDVAREQLFQRAGLEEQLRFGQQQQQQLQFQNALQLLGIPLGVLGGGPGTLGATAGLTGVTQGGGSQRTQTSGRQPGQGLFK